MPKTDRGKPRTGPGGSEQLFPVTRPEDVFGCLRYNGPPKSIEEMDAAVLEEAERSAADGRCPNRPSRADR